MNNVKSMFTLAYLAITALLALHQAQAQPQTIYYQERTVGTLDPGYKTEYIGKYEKSGIVTIAGALSCNCYNKVLDPANPTDTKPYMAVLTEGNEGAVWKMYEGICENDASLIAGMPGHRLCTPGRDVRCDLTEVSAYFGLTPHQPAATMHLEGACNNRYTLVKGGGNARLYGGAYGTPGHQGQGVYFNGNTSYVTMDKPAQVDFSGDFSVALWMFPHARNNMMLVEAEAGLNTSWSLRLIDYKLEVSLPGLPSTPWIGNTYVPAGHWCHIALSYTKGTGSNQGSLTLYVNGNKGASYTVAVGDLNLSGAQKIFIGGSRNPNNREAFWGTIDEVHFFNETISDQAVEIMALAPSSPGDCPLVRESGYVNFDQCHSNSIFHSTVLPDGVKIKQGHVNGAAWFSGSGGFIREFDYINLSPWNIYGCSFWVKPLSSDGSVECLVYFYPHMSGPPYSRIVLNNRVPEVILVQRNGGSSPTARSFSTNETLPVGQWSHIGVTSDLDAFRIYINGEIALEELYGLDPVTGSYNYISFYNGTHLLGAQQDNSQPFEGAIDEFRYYWRGGAPGPAQMRELYQRDRSPALSISDCGDDPQAYYPFDFSDCNPTVAKDDSGKQPDATLVGTTPVAGRIGQGLNFGDGNDYVNLGTTIPFSERFREDWVNGFTVAMWIKPKVITGREVLWAVAPDDDKNWGAIIFLDEGHPAISMPGMSIAAPFELGTKITANDWTHLAFTYERGRLMVYVGGNGTELARDLTGDLRVNHGSEMWLGCGYSINNEVVTKDKFYKGDMDDVRIYNYAVEASQIAAWASQAANPLPCN